MTLSPERSYEVNEPTVISETIDGETVIINLKSGSYYSLKHSGATVWAGLQQSASVADIASMVRASFDVNGQDIEEEVGRLIQRLLEEDLVRPAVEEATSQSIAPPSQNGLAPFQAPVLEKFTDMEAMLLLDPVHDVDDEGWPHLPTNDADA